MCGAPTKIDFRMNEFDDEYLSIRPITRVQEKLGGAQYFFAFYMESRVTPYVNANFGLLVNSSSNTLTMVVECRNLYNPQRESTLKAKAFSAHHFTQVQLQLGIKIIKLCTNLECKNAYSLETTPLTFDLSGSKMNSFELATESFSIQRNKLEHRFLSRFQSDITTVTVYKTGQRVDQSSLELKAHKFLEYPWDAEFFLNKARTLLTFS